MLTYSNIGFILSQIGKEADSLVFLQQAALLFEQIAKVKCDGKEAAHLSLLLMYGLRTRLIKDSFCDWRADNALKEIAPDQRRDYFHSDLYAELAAVLERLSL